MGEGKDENVDAASAEFRQGVEAGLNSEEDTKNRKAGNELGRELRAEVKPGGPVHRHPDGTPLTPLFPLFMRSSSEGLKAADQDEKDWMGE
jgi:hypothetical protein